MPEPTDIISARLSPFGFVGSISFNSAITPTSVARYVRLVERAQRWKKIKALILRINSPGGDAAASEQFFQALRNVDEVKPVYCYVDSVAASGGYYIACAGRRVYAPPNAMVGSMITLTLSCGSVSPVRLSYWLASPPLAVGEGKDEIGHPARDFTETPSKIRRTLQL